MEFEEDFEEGERNVILEIRTINSWSREQLERRLGLAQLNGWIPVSLTTFLDPPNLEDTFSAVVQKIHWND